MNYRLEETAARFVEYSRADKKSFARDECIIRKNLLPAFGKKNLDQITTWDIERYKARRKLEVSPASVNRELACLKTIYNKSIPWKLVKENPVRGIKFFKENNRRLRFLAPDEAHMLIESCAQHLRTLVIVALNTGRTERSLPVRHHPIGVSLAVHLALRPGGSQERGKGHSAFPPRGQKDAGPRRLRAICRLTADHHPKIALRRRPSAAS